MKQSISIFLVIVTSLLLYKCEPIYDGHKVITIVNKSNREISVQRMWGTPVNLSDTLWDCRKPVFDIEPDSLWQFNSARQRDFEYDFKYSSFLQLLIFDTEEYNSLINYDIPCNETNYTIPVKYYYQLKLEDLERMNWEVVYPPVEE